MTKQQRRLALLILFSIVTLIIISLSYWLFALDKQIAKKLQNKTFLRPIEFYAAPDEVRAGSQIDANNFLAKLKQQNYRERTFEQRLHPGDYSVWDKSTCATSVNFELMPEAVQCLLIYTNGSSKTAQRLQALVLDEKGLILKTLAGNPLAESDYFSFEPQKFAQYIATEPVLQNPISLGEIPPICLNAVLAIEDNRFLSHSGVSITSILRAMITNLTSGRAAQGGSTITQQMVKNYFLTPEKTIKRKLIEIIISVLLEARASKDDILETYLNIIYLGQSGTFQIRGYAAASDYYFNKPLQQLELPECALLAAIVNSPGLYNPFSKPENAQKRRELVLSKMLEYQMITETEEKLANQAALPTKPARLNVTETAPYFIDAVRRQLQALDLEEEMGLKIFTTLRLSDQSAAQNSVQKHLSRLESTNKKIKKLKEARHILEGVLVSADPQTGEVLALVGGRSFRTTQFNRALDSQRQVGSIFKPLVYLTALKNVDDIGEPYTPTTLITDEKKTYRYDNQSWSPDNYEKKFNGQVPLYFALKQSLNAATAELGMKVGLEKVIETARELGVTARLEPFPSLSLGAFEMSPLQVLDLYSTISRFGDQLPHTFIRSVEDGQNQILYTFQGKRTIAQDHTSPAVLVGILKQTLLSGTARFAINLGFTHPAAGKTGTTSDYKDAWFAGFTPHQVAIAWVGYDDNTAHGLTGASGAVPIWVDYMNQTAALQPPDDFVWPEGVHSKNLNAGDLSSLGVLDKNPNEPLSIDLIFKD